MIIDEAYLATFADVAATADHAQEVLFVGDPSQMGPVVTVVTDASIKGAEGDAGDGIPTPWYTEQAAIVHRKLRQRDEEIAVLKRWLTRCPKTLRAGSGIAERLAKLETK